MGYEGGSSEAAGERVGGGWTRSAQRVSLNIIQYTPKYNYMTYDAKKIRDVHNSIR